MTPSADRNRRHRLSDRGSQAVQTLERVWDTLRELHPCIPAAVLVVIDITARSRRNGHFAMSAWKARGENRAHEIAVSPRLFSQHRDVLAVLLHEAAHASLHDEGKNGGMGSTDYYHKKVFRDRCIQFGLNCEFYDTRYGWTVTSLPETKDISSDYRALLEELKHSLPYGTGGRTPQLEAGKLPPSGLVKLSCGCRSFRIARSIAEEGGLACRLCGIDFLTGTAESHAG